MLEQNNSPFRNKPIKAAYMWRDIERRAGKYGLAAKLPAPYPLKEFDLANRVAVVGVREGWCAKYVQGTYRRCFVEGVEAGSEPNLFQSIAEAGQELLVRGVARHRYRPQTALSRLSLGLARCM